MENLDSKLNSLSDLRSAPRKSAITSKLIPLIIVLIIISAGTFTGLVLSSRNKNAQNAPVAQEKEDLPEEVKESFSQTFKDEAEGVVEKNDDLDQYAQGTHKLIRPGGASQTAFLTSTVLDLDEYVGKKVKVYGESFGSQQVGWLMDVGKVEEIN